MAATAAYVTVARIPINGRSDEAYQMVNAVPASDAAFKLQGGLYGVTCKAATYGTVTLQILAGDGSTYLTALTAFSTDGYATIYLPPGQYRIHLA